MQAESVDAPIKEILQDWETRREAHDLEEMKDLSKARRPLPSLQTAVFLQKVNQTIVVKDRKAAL